MLFNAVVIFIISSILPQHLVSVYTHNIWYFCIILKSVKTHNTLLVLTVFLFKFLTDTLDFDNIDKVSRELIVSHNDFIEMQDSQMHWLNKVAECKTSPQKIYIAPGTNTF